MGPDRGVDELVECHRHESLLNLAFVDAGSFWLLCPYDVAALDPAVIAHARRTHPYVARGGERGQSADYLGADAFRLPFEAPLSAPATRSGFRSRLAPLESMRRLVADYAERAGLVRGRVLDLVLAINEIATNSVRHGGGRGLLRMWSDDGAPRVRDPRRRPVGRPAGRPGAPGRVVEPGGRGFWIANQLCDLVQLHSGPAGTIVRLHMATR